MSIPGRTGIEAGQASSHAGEYLVGTRHPQSGLSTPTAAFGEPQRVRSDGPFVVGLCVLGGVYLLLIVAMLLADLSFTTVGSFLAALRSPEIRYAIRLSLISCSLTALLSLWIAAPIGYFMSRYAFRGKALVDAVLDIPIVLPPLVIGVSLLILFRTPSGRLIERVIPMTYAVPGIILA